MSSGANDSVTNKQLLDEILKSRNELKNSIDASETRLLLKIESANIRINNLEKENKELTEKIEQLERENRRKNIILFGLSRPTEAIDPDFICSKLNSLLSLELKETDISNSYPIGKTETCPIKIEFSSYFKKILVLKHRNKLTGTGISIANDLSIKQRQENKVLRKYLALARIDGRGKNCHIKNNKLYVGDISYTAEELERDFTDTEFKSSSAPSTPSRDASVYGNKTEFQQGKVVKQVSAETKTQRKETPEKVPNKEPSTTNNQKVVRSTRAAAIYATNKTQKL